jgi:hypothetical protein
MRRQRSRGGCGIPKARASSLRRCLLRSRGSHPQGGGVVLEVAALSSRCMRRLKIGGRLEVACVVSKTGALWRGQRRHPQGRRSAPRLGALASRRRRRRFGIGAILVDAVAALSRQWRAPQGGHRL